MWRDLLGSERYALAEILAKESSEDFDIAATRVWSVAECLKKAGVAYDAPLMFDKVHDSEWVSMGSGSMTIATAALRVRDFATPVVFSALSATAVLHTGAGHAGV